MRGPLTGTRIIEIAGIGPGPFAAMMLADQGAEVISICRPGTQILPTNVLARNRRSMVLDLKQPEGAAVLRDLCRTADGLIEGFRPGVMERLGLGPDILLADNPRLVYGRITGWGQTGPYAQKAGHDINFIAVAGALHGLGRAGEKPTPPINLVGDFGGGGMLVAFGMVSALLHAARTGEGQVVDCAMNEGSALLMSMMWWFLSEGRWLDERGVNTLDTGAHFYDTYATSDGRFLAVGSVETPFYRALLEVTGLADDPEFAQQRDAAAWPPLKERLAAIIATRTRDEWVEAFAPYDACISPVLSMREAPLDPHNQARNVFVDVAGVTQPAPAPRYSRTPCAMPESPVSAAADTNAILRSLGYDDGRMAMLAQAGVIVQEGK